MNRPRFADHHPYWFVALLELVTISVYLLAGTIAHLTRLTNYGLYGVANLTLSGMVAVLLTLMGWWKAVGFTAPRKPRDLLYFIVPLLPIVVNLVVGLEITSLLLLMELLGITLLVGFAEEAIFRGLMLTALKPRGLWRAASITALLFGLSHSLNVLAGQSVAQTAAQIFYATAFGFAFAALVLKKGIVWPLVIAHFLIDFSSFLQRPSFTIPPDWNLLLVTSIAVIFTSYGVFVMLQKEPVRSNQVYGSSNTPPHAAVSAQQDTIC